MTQRLIDIGERELLRGLIKTHCQLAGGDCAVLPFDLDSVVVTTDPVPMPAAGLVAGDKDPYWAGWLLVTINASDLAASGARPVGFVAAIEAPGDMAVAALGRVLEGVRDSCQAAGLAYAGGNLREAKTFGATGTAIGKCRSTCALRRDAASAGDVLISVGDLGVFWRDVFEVRSGGKVSPRRSPLFRPRSQIAVMHVAAEAGLIGAAMDNSDGLLPTLEELSRANGLGIEVDLALLRACVETSSGDIDPARLCLGWGDWNVVCSVREQELDEARKTIECAGGRVFHIGRFVDTQASVLIRGERKVSSSPRLESERFAADSWFSAGIEAYIERLLSVPLPE